MLTFAAPLFTKPDLNYYRYSGSQKMCGLHWEYPAFAIITGLYIPILSGVVLIFTGCRISSTLRRRSPLSSQPSAVDTAATAAAAVAAADGRESSGFWFCHRLKFFAVSPASEMSADVRDDDLPLDELATNVGSGGGGGRGGSAHSPLPLRQQHSSGALTTSYDNSSRQRWTRGNRRTLRILTFTGIAYFVCWGPYVAIVFAKSFLPSLSLPSAIEFLFMWLANANSGVNVFIYSSTNVAFRRQCLWFAGRLLMCCCCGCGKRRPRQVHGRMTSKRSLSMAGDCDSAKCRPFPSVAPEVDAAGGRRHAPSVLMRDETAPRAKDGCNLPITNALLTVPSKFVVDSASV